MLKLLLATAMSVALATPAEATARRCGVVRDSIHFCHEQLGVKGVQMFAVDVESKSRIFIQVDCANKHIKLVDASEDWTSEKVQQAARFACRYYFPIEGPTTET